MATDQTTTAPDEPDTPSLVIGADRDTPRLPPSDKIVLFRLDGDDHTLVGVRPKMAVLIRVLAALNDNSNELRQAMVLTQMISKVVDEDTADYLNARLDDPDDDFDIIAADDSDGPCLIDIFRTLVGLWYEGPTGGPRGSGQSRKRSGRSSTVRQPSRG
jgi:hypothetical protein